MSKPTGVLYLPETKQILVANGDDNGAVKMPDNSYLTHILKTNTKGEFTYVPARAGWWALTAITETKGSARSPDGKKVESELGGVLWIRCVDMK